MEKLYFKLKYNKNLNLLKCNLNKQSLRFLLFTPKPDFLLLLKLGARKK